MNAIDGVRLPPHSNEAEQFLLGALMLDPGSWDKIDGRVSDADFYRDDHRRIFRHIRMLAERGIDADILAVFDSIERAGEQDQTGGLAYLSDICNATPGVSGIVRHAEIVIERTKLRKLISIGDDLSDSCFSPGARKSADIVAEIEQRLAIEQDDATSAPVRLVEAMQDAMSYVDSRGEVGGLKTGFDGFDRLTGGLEPGQLVIVAARPSVGKTSLACNVADMVATGGGSVIFHTLEMTRRDIAMRIMSSRSSVSVHSMRCGTKDNDEWHKMTGALTSAESTRLWIDDTPAVSVANVRAKARWMKRTHGLDLIVIDYLGLMRGTGDNRTQEIGSISRGLKTLAKELGTPIIALAQLNRGVESRLDKRPMMSDLRDSGEIEQDADIVAILHRESMYDDAPHWAGFSELILRKNRNGQLGTVDLEYSGSVMRFSPWMLANPRVIYQSRKNREYGND